MCYFSFQSTLQESFFMQRHSQKKALQFHCISCSMWWNSRSKNIVPIFENFNHAGTSGLYHAHGHFCAKSAPHPFAIHVMLKISATFLIIPQRNTDFMHLVRGERGPITKVLSLILVQQVKFMTKHVIAIFAVCFTDIKSNTQSFLGPISCHAIHMQHFFFEYVS